MNNNIESEEHFVETCTHFLNGIGIKTIFKETEAPGFLPGLTIENGCIIIDKEKLEHPGDILHEAGHIAVVPALERDGLQAAAIEKRTNREAEEMMAIAWSYAASIHLNIDPYLVFHDHGYKGAGRNIADNFGNKQYFGVPMLQWIGLTADEKNAANLNIEPYPHMIKWLRE